MDLKFQPPGKLFTVSEYWALGETEYRCELQEGLIVPRPSLPSTHQIARMALWEQVDRQLPAGFESVSGVDVDMELVPPDRPGFCRCPDLIVIPDCSIGDSLIRAAEVSLVAEIVSPGTRMVDYKFKRIEYAEARIPYYWILDLNTPVSLLACELTETSGYVDTGEITGTFTTVQPFPVVIDLASLLTQ